MKYFFLSCVLTLITWHSSATCRPIHYGRVDAPLTVIEYAAPSCVVCSVFQTTLFPKLLKNYIMPGRVRLIVINLPYNLLDLEACALIQKSPDPQTAHTYVYGTQKLWLFKKEPIQALRTLLKKQALAPLSPTDETLKNEILHQRFGEEKQRNIDAIPMLVIGQKIIVGLMPWNKLQMIMDQALVHVSKGYPLASFGAPDGQISHGKKTRTPSG